MKNKFIYLLSVGVLWVASACQNEVLDQQPQAALANEVALNDRFGVNAGLLGIYDALQNASYYGTRWHIFGDMAADNLAHVGTFPSFAQIKNRAILPDNAEIVNGWSVIYSGINRANNVIAAAPRIQDPAFNNNQALGEARFLRALMYFDLVRTWGGVPLVLEPTTSPNPDVLNVRRATEQEVYRQVIEDLTFAEQNLPDVRPGRATRWAATALKSRVYLYTRNFQEAVNSAELIARSNRFGLVPNYRSLYETKNSAPEALLELDFNSVDQGSMAFFNWPAAIGGRNEVSPTGAGSTLPNAYEAGDLRRNASIAPTGGVIIDGRSIPAGRNIKYFRIGNGDDNIIILRYAEVLLNRAEALVELNRVDDALVFVNQVRRRAGLADLASGLSQADARLAVERERRVELALEGHRWWDLKRTGRLQAVLGVNNTNAFVWPIPLRETINNPNMQQNPGY
ncbi:MAG: RagB/SusD family nutrient uptake outer membrane protein [Bernardetiaceae bacterium]|nr:RagB/SusD family nutrient uptake outer membrane protein [Bernardetiaceae bacterium]